MLGLDLVLKTIGDKFLILPGLIRKETEIQLDTTFLQ